MPSPNATPTPITPPRVPLIDPRTNLIDRAWYMFFLSLLNTATTVYETENLGPSAESLIASYDAALQALAQNVDTQPLPADLNAELTKQIEAAGLASQSSALLSQIAEMQKQLEALNLLPQLPPAALTVGSSILYGDNLGGFSNVTIGSGVSFSAGTLSATGTGGTVTSVTGTAPVVSSGGTTPAISLAAAYGDTLNPYASKTANYVLASPSGSAGVPSFRALTSTDIPALSYVSSVSGTTGRITSTGGLTPVIDLASGVATAGTTGSSTLIPVVTIDTYGRVTSITTAANPQGTVTSVTGTSPVVSSGGSTPAISLAAGYGDILNPYASKTANYFLAAPNGSAGVPTFRAIVAADIPALPYGTGTVTSVSVVSANGFAGTVATATTTPAITLTTTVTGLIKGNGTAISAATANTDYQGVAAPVTKTADFTVSNGDIWYINNKTGSTCVVTLPAASSWSGRTLTFKNMQAQLLNSASSNVVPIDSTTAGTAILLNVIGNWATMVSDGTNWVIMQAASNNNLLLE